MQFSDSFRITQGKTLIFTGQLFSEIIKIFQISLNLNLRVKENWDNGLSGTSIVDNLPCKKEVIIIDS